MNNNDTSILTHESVLAIVQQADQIADDYLEREGEWLSTAGLLLGAVEMITENCEYELEVRITAKGYQIAFPQTKNANEVLDDFERAFDVTIESLYEPLD